MTDTHLPGPSGLLSIALTGLDAHLVHVEAVATRGSTHFQINGLPETTACEIRIHVRSALAALGVRLDDHRVVVDVIPSQLGTGGSFDVVIALAVLTSLGLVPEGSLDGIALLGGLSLSGDLRPVRGTLPALCGARDQGVTHAIVPEANAAEAGAVPGICVLVASHLRDVVAHVREGAPLAAASASAVLRWHVDTQLLTPEQRESPLLFPSITGGFRAPCVLNKPLAEVAEDLKLGKNITQRGLRRTFNDLARAARVDDLVTRSISGHMTETMQHHYSTVSGAEQRRAVAQVIQLFARRDAAEDEIAVTKVNQ